MYTNLNLNVRMIIILMIYSYTIFDFNIFFVKDIRQNLSRVFLVKY